MPGTGEAEAEEKAGCCSVGESERDAERRLIAGDGERSCTSTLSSASRAGAMSARRQAHHTTPHQSAGMHLHGRPERAKCEQRPLAPDDWIGSGHDPCLGCHDSCVGHALAFHYSSPAGLLMLLTSCSDALNSCAMSAAVCTCFPCSPRKHGLSLSALRAPCRRGHMPWHKGQRSIQIRRVRCHAWSPRFFPSHATPHACLRMVQCPPRSQRSWPRCWPGRTGPLWA